MTKRTKYRMTIELSMRSSTWNVIDSNQPIIVLINMINRGQVKDEYDHDMTVQKMSHDFVRVQSVAETKVPPCWNLHFQYLLQPRWGYYTMYTAVQSQNTVSAYLIQISR